MSEQDRCYVEPIDKPLDHAQLAHSLVAYLRVHGMGCPRCATRVRNGLLALNGVLLADVFLPDGMAAAAFDPKLVTPDDLLMAVASAGNDGRHHYRAETLKVALATEALVM